MSAALSGTKIDSAARHNVVARVCESFMSQFRLAEEIQNNKHAYCCKKNELLLGIGRPFNSESGVSVAEDKAYLPVISNVGIFSTPGQVRAASSSSRVPQGAWLALRSPTRRRSDGPPRPSPRARAQTPAAAAEPHAVDLRTGRHRPTAVVC